MEHLRASLSTIAAEVDAGHAVIPRALNVREFRGLMSRIESAIKDIELSPNLANLCSLSGHPVALFKVSAAAEAAAASWPAAYLC